MRRKFLVQVAGLSLGAAAPGVFGQETAGAAAGYPDRPVKIIVAFAPGGSVDPIIRVCVPKLHEVLGQPFVLENRPGGTTSIACAALLQAPADGYTLLFTGANTHIIHTIDQPHIRYDPLKDFVAISPVSRSGYVLAVHPSVPARTIAEYAAYCKANPGKISYASTGVGNANHMAMERLNMALGIKTTHVPYKVAATAYLDFLAGRVQAYFSTPSVLQGGINEGKLHALAYTAMQQGEAHTQMTFAAAGLPELENIDSLNVLLGPKGMPPALVAKLESSMKRVLDMPDIKAAFASQKQYAPVMTARQLETRMSADMVRYRQLIKDANIRIEG